MSEQFNLETKVGAEEEQRKQRGLWAAGIFTALSIAFAGISMYAVFAMQQGRFYLEDAVLMPSTIVAVVLGILSYSLIRRGRHRAGVELLFIVMMGLPVVAILLIDNFLAIVIFYTIIFASVMYNWVLPRTSRRRAVSIIALEVLAMIGIEIWNPGFRGTSDFAAGILPIAIVLAAVVLIGFLVRQASSGSIRQKLVISFTIIALISVAIVGTVVYISYRNQVREDIRQRLLNIVTITAKRLDGDLHATLQTPEDMQTEAYRQMMAEGDEIIATDPDLIFSYTMRLNEQGQIYFIIDSRRADDTERDALGTIYDEPSETLQAFFNAPDHPIVEEEIYTDKYGSVLSAFAPFYRADGSLEGIFGIDIAADAVLARERAVLFLILGTTLGTMILVTLLGLFLGNLFVGPVVNLSAVAKKITEGDLSARATIETQDEIGELASDFNLMTAQLQETLQGLEQRVADRTRNLELAAEVGRSVSQVRTLEVMLRDACDLIQKEFDLYYVQVYLTDPSQTNLILQSGTGSVGEQLISRRHILPLNVNSINGRAAVEKKSVVIADTAQSATFRPNPLLPNTRSEMAVPLIVGEKVVGVLDMQSDRPGALSQEMLPAFEALAGQLAVAIQNANLLAEAEQARAEVEKQARRLARTQWTEYMDAIHTPERLGFAFEGGQVLPLEQPLPPAEEGVLSAPIAVTGQPLGSLVVELEQEKRTSQNAELVQAVARQVAQQVESLRLLESAERYRVKAEQAARRLTREGWTSYLETREEQRLAYLYDLNKVQPVAPEQAAGEQVVTLPLQVRDEIVGKLAIQGISPDDKEALELANAVAERLSAHIESLRQYDQTQAALTQTEKLSDASLRFTQAADLQELVKVAVEVLAIPQINRALLEGFTFNEDNKLESITALANWWSGEGREPTRLGTTVSAGAMKSLHLLVGPEPVFSDNVLEDPRIASDPATMEFMRDNNIHSLASLPLFTGNRQIGSLLLETEKPHHFSDDEVRLFIAMGPQIATVLENRRQFERTQKQAEREAMLNVISQKIQGATSVESVLQIAARELGHALGAPLTIAQLGLQQPGQTDADRPG